MTYNFVCQVLCSKVVVLTSNDCFLVWRPTYCYCLYLTKWTWGSFTI